MRKIILSCIALLSAFTCNAQSVQVMKGGKMIAEFFERDGWEFVFNEMPIHNGHRYVDLGLPSGTLWATCNVGADNPEDYGLYFAWGETTGYTSDTSDGRQFDWANYKWCNGSIKTMTKYCTSDRYGIVDNKTELDLEDDAAHANWGGNWRMPSQAQQEELLNSTYTTATWTTFNGINGYRITSKSNGNSIFLPAAGYRTGSSFYDGGSNGYYWSRSLGLNSSALILDYDAVSIGADGYMPRYVGISIRPVYSASE